MGDQDDINQAKWMGFVSHKAGTRSWVVSDRARELKTIKGTVVVPRATFETWRKEFEESQ